MKVVLFPKKDNMKEMLHYSEKYPHSTLINNIKKCPYTG